MPSPRARAHGDAGQASVELLALLPLIALLGLLAWQAVMAGHARWAAGAAARAAARAQALGHDPLPAARGALPDGLERGLRVQREADDGVRVTVRVPVVLNLPVRLGSVSARARLEPQE